MKKTRAYAGNRALCLLLSQLRVLADTVRSFTLWINLRLFDTGIVIEAVAFVRAVGRVSNENCDEWFSGTRRQTCTSVCSLLRIITNAKVRQYVLAYRYVIDIVCFGSGGRGRDRTYDQSIKSRMLYQLSYASFGFAPDRRSARVFA